MSSHLVAMLRIHTETNLVREDWKTCVIAHCKSNWLYTHSSSSHCHRIVSVHICAVRFLLISHQNYIKARFSYFCRLCLFLTRCFFEYPLRSAKYLRPSFGLEAGSCDDRVNFVDDARDDDNANAVDFYDAVANGDQRVKQVERSSRC